MGRKEGKLRNIKKIKPVKNMSSLLFAMLALVLTVIVFSGLLFLQSLFKEDVTYKSVVVAKTNILENEIITAENAGTYFEMKNMNILDTMDGSLSSVDSLIGAQAKVPMYAGEIVTVKDFSAVQDNSGSFQEPVEISIYVGDISSSDGGKIRAGDVVNIAMMFDREQLGLSGSLQSTSTSLFTPAVTATEDEDELFGSEEEGTEETTEGEETATAVQAAPVVLTNEDLLPGSTSGSDYVFNYYAKYVLEDVYVQKALDDNGNEIAPTDTTSAASILVFVIEKNQELAINNALANCTNIRVSRAVEKKSPRTDTETIQDDTVEQGE